MVPCVMNGNQIKYYVSESLKIESKRYSKRRKAKERKMEKERKGFANV